MSVPNADESAGFARTDRHVVALATTPVVELDSGCMKCLGSGVTISRSPVDCDTPLT
jgi:hypothetical protein